jgi:hypothetical protein
LEEQIEIEIDSMGKVTIKTLGLKGTSCLDAINALVALIGKEQSTELTAEYYEEHVEVGNSISVKLRNG